MPDDDLTTTGTTTDPDGSVEGSGDGSGAAAEPAGDPPESDGPPQPDEARRRLWGSAMHPTRSQVVVGVLLAALGFAAVTQVRSNDVDNTYASYREQDLVDVLSTLTEASQRAQSELARLETTRRDLINQNSSREVALASAEQAADSLEIMAGQVPVTGPGVRIVVTETTGTVDVDSLLDTVQELRTAGAEAMEFNDEVRVVAQTSFTDAVGGILIDGTLVSSPFVLNVIGDPRTLQGAMSFVQGPTDQLEHDGATVEVTPLAALDIDAVRPPTRAEYAQPTTAQ